MSPLRNMLSKLAQLPEAPGRFLENHRRGAKPTVSRAWPDFSPRSPLAPALAPPQARESASPEAAAASSPRPVLPLPAVPGGQLVHGWLLGGGGADPAEGGAERRRWRRG